MPELRLLAIVFCDIVESTALLVRLGDDAFDDLRRQFESLIQKVVRDGAGEIVKSMGDGAMLTFATPSQAVGSAVELQRSNRRLARRLDLPGLLLRVGMSAGEVALESGDVNGIAVVEAARLCAVAQPGQILASDGVAALARRTEHKLRPIGELALKGLPDPMTAFEVDWEMPDEEPHALGLLPAVLT
jgi:adenylate cyclase